ncbi:uncharacterized protein LOC121877476 isoform X2 [Homarus americanus]|uniref:uncharacterized protein LOC121877476 isoform X2 n=1 Tax=Homarus americanus TaxID=6706 RepID=UPI001C496E5F|nr:uncharacterized protein LOC121877476 isoform X2 [Homarus americanus]
MVDMHSVTRITTIPKQQDTIDKMLPPHIVRRDTASGTHTEGYKTVFFDNLPSRETTLRGGGDLEAKQKSVYSDHKDGPRGGENPLPYNMARQKELKTSGEKLNEIVSHGTSENVLINGALDNDTCITNENNDESKPFDLHSSVKDDRFSNNCHYPGKINGIDCERQRIGKRNREIGGSVREIRCSEWKIKDSLRKIGSSDWKVRGSDSKTKGSYERLGGSVGKIEDSGEKIGSYFRKSNSCGGKIGSSDGKINCLVTVNKSNNGSSNILQKPTRSTELLTKGYVEKDDLVAASLSGRRNKSVSDEEEEVRKIGKGTASKLGRAFSFSPASKNKPATPTSTSRVNRLLERWLLRKSNPIFPSFSQFINDYIFKPLSRKSSDPTTLKTETDGDERGKGGDELKCSGCDLMGNEEKGDKTKREFDHRKIFHKFENSEEKETVKNYSEKGHEREEWDDEVFIEADEYDCQKLTRKYDKDNLQDGDNEEYLLESGWVKKRVSQIERQIATKKLENTQSTTRKKSSDSILPHITEGDMDWVISKATDTVHSLTIVEGEEERVLAGNDKTNDKKDEMQEETVELKTAETENSGDDSDTDTEEDEVGDIVVFRSKSQNRPTSLYRSSNRPPSLYRYSALRPRTLIIGLGVCTETQFFSESFGDGVSETESEDEEEDAAPITIHPAHTTPTTPRPQSRPSSPSRMSRSHSPLSDMDTESKRNSQAVSTEPSDLEDHSSLTTSDLESCHDLAALDARKDKAYRIVLELLHTERTYVKVLHLIDQEFQFRVDNENRAHHMFPQDVIPHMFSNVKSIYKLHHDFLLPQLEERMAQWEQNRRIGDIMKSFAPFLKMYTEYVRNFDNAMTLISQWQSKCPRFAAIMDEIHSLEVCGNLTLQHHMLSPVQRIPRYEMLLRDYLKKLPEDSPDRHDTEKALHLVSTAANHANDAMKKIDKFEKLLEIQESLGGAEDLVSPTRELIKEGKIIKISARSGDHQERYIFLLTDLLLLCSPRLMGGRVMSGPQYRLRAKYHVENLMVQEGDNLETANTFYIKDNNKSVELYTQTLEEKEQWLEAFIRAIHETSQRKSSLKLHFNPDQRIVDVDLGQKQPMLIRSDSVTKCMLCSSQFTMVRRKHHCRACGESA